MATILEFRPRSRHVPRAVEATSAEIMIFPGVRYERWEDPAPVAPRPRSAARRRKRDAVEAAD